MNEKFTNKINSILKEIPALEKRLPGIVKVIGLNFIADNFAKQGFERVTGSYDKWKKRKAGKSKRSRKRAGRAILVDAGKMKRSFNKDSRVGQHATAFISTMPYTEVHNDGLKSGRGDGFKMPQREMIGDSKALEKRIEKKLDQLVTDILE